MSKRPITCLPLIFLLGTVVFVGEEIAQVQATRAARSRAETELFRILAQA